MFSAAKNFTRSSPLKSCMLKFWYIIFGIVTRSRLPKNRRYKKIVKSVNYLFGIVLVFKIDKIKILPQI